jgi:hypothetical protein
MAKTKMKKQKEVAISEEVVHLEPVKQATESEFLAPEHLLILEVGQREIENARLKMALEEQNLRGYILEQHLLANKIEKQKQVVQSLSKAYEAEKEKFITQQKNIWPMYGLELDKGLGYDSISGKIVKGKLLDDLIVF